MPFVVEIEHLLGNLEPLVHDYGAAAVMIILTFESLDLMIAGPEGGPSSDMQRYEG